MAHKINEMFQVKYNLCSEVLRRLSVSTIAVMMMATIAKLKNDIATTPSIIAVVWSGASEISRNQKRRLNFILIASEISIPTVY